MSDNLFREEISSSQIFLGAKEEERRDFIFRIKKLSSSMKKLKITFHHTQNFFNFLATQPEKYLIFSCFKFDFELKEQGSDVLLKDIFNKMNQIQQSILSIDENSTVSFYLNKLSFINLNINYLIFLLVVLNKPKNN